MLQFFSVLKDVRLINGDVANPGQFPYQAYIKLNKIKRLVCGGAIVSKNLVITAASCFVYGTSVKVVVGSDDRRKGIKYEAAEVIIHKDYNSTTLLNNIALVKTVEEIKFSADLVQPIAIRRTPVDTGALSVTSGWGIAEKTILLPILLHFLEMTTVDNEKCPTVEGFKVYEGTLCAFVEKGKGLCTGDLGDPLVVRGELVGIASWGKICGLGYPDAFTRISYFVNWLDEHMKE